jgi:hypothetical protein
VNGRQHLAALIAAEHPEPFREDLRTITGVRSDLEIADWVDELARRQLGQAVAAAPFGGKSVGAVFGLELVTGERVVLKLFHPMHTRDELQAMHRCLERLVTLGFPAPPLRTSLFDADDHITGVFYQWVDGEFGDGHDPGIRRALARSLAGLADLVSRMDARGLPLSPTRAKDLWPAPHRSFDDLTPHPATAWIDDVGRRSQTVISAVAAPLHPVHLDWGVKNARFLGGQVCAVYDWDSLATGSEAEMVGRASVEFPTQWEQPVRLTPTREQSAAFVADYELARGRAFTAEEHAVIEAAADYLIAQVARQEQGREGSEREDGFTSLLRTRIEARGTG